MVHGVCRAKSTAVGFYKLVPDDVDLKEAWGEVGVIIMFPINTMKDMYEIIKESDKVVTF